MTSIDAALVLTGLSNPASDCRTSQKSLRIHRALALNIGGIFVAERRAVLYRLEGNPADIDRFLDAMAPETDESLLMLIDRWTVPRRVTMRRRLREALPIGDEREWMRRQLTAPQIDAGMIRLFTLWLDVRVTERDMGLGLDFTSAALNHFPGSPFH